MPTWLAQNLGKFIRCDALHDFSASHAFDGANIPAYTSHAPLSHAPKAVYYVC